MLKDEYFDIYDPNQKWIGTATRNEVHAKGLWHQTFHCWIVKKELDETYMLFQRRHSSKDTFPNLLDISCAGHLEAGEMVTDGVRELAEELGLHVSFEELIACGVHTEEVALPRGGMDREFSHVFVYLCNRELNEYEVQLEEVTGLYWIALTDVIKLAQGHTEQVPAYGIDIDEHGMRSDPAFYTFSIDEFVPHEWKYYQLIVASLLDNKIV